MRYIVIAQNRIDGDPEAADWVTFTGRMALDAARRSRDVLREDYRYVFIHELGAMDVD